MCITKRDRISSDLQRTEQEVEPLITCIEQHQLKLFGNMVRAEEETQVKTTQLLKKETKEGPWTTWDNVTLILNEDTSSWDQGIRKGKDKKKQVGYATEKVMCVFISLVFFIFLVLSLCHVLL